MGIGAAILGSAAIGVGGSILASKSQSDAAGDAADASLQAAQLNADIAREQLAYVQEINAPYQQVGTNALNVMAGQLGVAGTEQGAPTQPDYSAFYTSPGYDFRLQQGQKAIDNALIARGQGLSGSQVRAANDYAQGQASSEYGNWFNRIAGLAGMGQGANQSAMVGSANAYGNLMDSNTAGGQGAALGYLGQGQAQADMYGNLSGIASGTLGNYFLAQQFAQPTGWPTNVTPGYVGGTPTGAPVGSLYG